jgi:hypothetical protein
MAAQYESRHPRSTVPVSADSPETALRGPLLGATPHTPTVIHSTVRAPSPQVGDSARLWDYVELDWIEGKIESIQHGYRILVRCGEHLEETAGWYLAFRDGAWEEDIVGVTGTD